MISPVYAGSLVKMEFEDAAGRRFWQTPSSIKKGAWSPYEAKLVKDADAYYKILLEIARLNGGRVISVQFVSATDPMEFEDAAGRRFWQKPCMIKKGLWSPYESGYADSHNPDKQIAEQRRRANARGGQCNSDHYLGAKSVLSFTDIAGCPFEAIPHRIGAGRWTTKERLVSPTQDGIHRTYRATDGGLVTYAHHPGDITRVVERVKPDGTRLVWKWIGEEATITNFAPVHDLDQDEQEEETVSAMVFK